MPKATRSRGGTVGNTAQAQVQDALLIGKFMIIRDGVIEWLDGTGGLPDATLSRDSSGTLSFGAVLALEGAASATDVFTVKVDGDTDPQLVINANGRIEFGSGSAGVDVALFRDGGTRLHTINTFVTEGDLVMDVAGGGLNVTEGTNARMGADALVGGTVTVATTEVTADSRIFLTSQVDGGTPGFLRVSARNAATDFTITSSSGTDTSTVAWMIVEPA